MTTRREEAEKFAMKTPTKPRFTSFSANECVEIAYDSYLAAFEGPMVTALVEALKFYADGTLEPDEDIIVGQAGHNIYVQGKRARAALLGFEAGGGEVTGKTFKLVGNDISDGYHTFDELYEHRVLLFINLALTCPTAAFWRPHYEGWPLLGMVTPQGKQITYHVPEKYLPLFKDRITQGGPDWDGHTSAEVIERLKEACEVWK